MQKLFTASLEAMKWVRLTISEFTSIVTFYVLTDSFRIDSSSGAITVNNVLDKEMIEEYSLTVLAENIGTSQLNSTVSPIITETLHVYIEYHFII